LKEVEMFKVPFVILLCQDVKRGSKFVGKRKIFARIFADVGKMWGKLRNRKSLKSLISRL
jgi:hypothetical protein